MKVLESKPVDTSPLQLPPASCSGIGDRHHSTIFRGHAGRSKVRERERRVQGFNTGAVQGIIHGWYFFLGMDIHAGSGLRSPKHGGKVGQVSKSRRKPGHSLGTPYTLSFSNLHVGAPFSSLSPLRMHQYPDCCLDKASLRDKAILSYLPPGPGRSRTVPPLDPSRNDPAPNLVKGFIGSGNGLG